MKIEIGESLLVSWLRHVKKCQIVQTNWKASKSWPLKNKAILQTLMEESRAVFSNNHAYEIYKKTSSVDQLIKQAEIDVVGLAFNGEKSGTEIYAIDVAFHEGGLMYGSKEDTVGIVVKKCLRSAMCIYGYYGFTEGTIVFTAPKIHPSVLSGLEACIEDMQAVLTNVGLNYKVQIITNDDFNNEILDPVLKMLGDVADTSELFMRSLQLYNMFVRERADQLKTSKKNVIQGDLELQPLKEPAVGELAQKRLRKVLEEGVSISPEDVEKMQTAVYSKDTFHLSYPLLRKTDSGFEKARYYVKPLMIFGESYVLCSQWTVQHRPFLLAWLEAHQA